MVTSTQVGKYGRLGNQLFQIAACIGYTKLYNEKFMLLDWYCTYTKKDMLPFFENKVTCGPIRPTWRDYQEPHFHFSGIPKYVGTLNLKGYFQSELYFQHCTELVRYYFKPTKHVQSKLISKYGDMTDTCSIHVRRGDYVNHWLHGVTTIDYYNRAMVEMERLKPVRKYFVFSDDPTWCEQNFRGDRFIFVKDNLDIEDLFLMSMCKNNIITNSSFSWWGSWLNSNPEKTIIVPGKWFNGNNINDLDVYTKEMKKL